MTKHPTIPKEDKEIAKAKEVLADALFAVIRTIFERNGKVFEDKDIKNHNRKIALAKAFDSNPVNADNVLANTLDVASKLIVADATRRTVEIMGEEEAFKYLESEDWHEH